MKNYRLLLLLIIPLVSSCSRHFYAPALYNNDVAYQPKPTSFDSVKSAGYVSLGFGSNEGVSSSNTITFSELNISHAHVFNNVNLSYGAFGFAGSIDNSNYDNEKKTDPVAFKSKGFGGVGGRLSVNMFQVMENINFRYLGFEAVYSKEFGDFAAFRQDVHNLPNYNTTTRTEMVTIGGTSEILWQGVNNHKNQFAFRLFIGKTLGDYSYLDGSDRLDNSKIYVAGSFFAKLNRFYGAAELTRDWQPITGFRMSFGYKF